MVVKFFLFVCGFFLREVKEEGMNEMDSHVRPSDGKQKPPIAGKDFGETRTGGAPDNDSPRSQIKNDGKN